MPPPLSRLRRFGLAALTALVLATGVLTSGVADAAPAAHPSGVAVHATTTTGTAVKAPARAPIETSAAKRAAAKRAAAKRAAARKAAAKRAAAKKAAAKKAAAKKAAAKKAAAKLAAARRAAAQQAATAAALPPALTAVLGAAMPPSAPPVNAPISLPILPSPPLPPAVPPAPGNGPSSAPTTPAGSPAPSTTASAGPTTPTTAPTTTAAPTDGATASPTAAPTQAPTTSTSPAPVTSTPGASPPGSTGNPADAFIGHSGASLTLNGAPYRFGGTNMYWLALDDNVKDSSGAATYPTRFRIDDAMTEAQDAGVTVVRAWANTVGCARCIEPSLGSFNDQGFSSLDYAIASARAHGIRLVLTLADNWSYYDGGKLTYTGWRGLQEADFWSNPTVIGDYEQFIDHVVGHVNTVTGVTYDNDPTIMGWETGNEMYCQTCAGNAWDGSWTATISAHIKSVAPHQLVISGHGVDNSCSTNCLSSADLAAPAVDMVDDHFYPMHTDRVASAEAQAAAAGKAYMVGEFDWANHDAGGSSLSDFLSAVSSSGAAGDLSWVFVPHDDTAGLVDHNDGFQLFYPGRTPDEQNRVALLRDHDFAMSGRGVAAFGVPAAPVLGYGAVDTSSVHVLWRGSADAVTYVLQRSVNGGPWITVVNTLTDVLVDADPGYVDTGLGQNTEVSYRLQAVNISGAAGPWSSVMQVSTS